VAECKSNEIYKIELFGRGYVGNLTAFIDLIAYDQYYKTIYLANTINTDSKMKLFMAEMLETKTGTIHRAEGPIRAEGHENYTIYTGGKKFYDTFDSKVEDLTNVLFIAKCANPNIKDRQDWQKEEDARLAQGLPPRPAPEELILAWDGDYKKQIFKVLWDRYNTPMLEEWADYIVETCIARQYYKPLVVKSYGREYDLEAGLLSITERQLEAIITEGIASYELNFAVMEDGRSDDESILKDCTTLDTYLENFAGPIGERIQENSELRFDPTKEKHHKALYHLNMHANQNGVTGLFPPQADVVMGVANTLSDENYCFIIGEMGVGKTCLGPAAVYTAEAMQSGKEKPNPFRTLVFVPSIMVDKWIREIKERVPDAKVFQINSWKDVIPLKQAPYKPEQIEFYVMSSDTAKQTYPVEPELHFRYGVTKDLDGRQVSNELKDALETCENRHEIHPAIKIDTVWRDGNEVTRVVVGETGYYCPQCGGLIMQRKGKPADAKFFKHKNSTNYCCQNEVETANLPSYMIKDKNATTQKCGYIFWQPQKLKETSLSRKVAPAWYINKYLRRGFFKYLIADEVHEYKSGESDRAKAFGQLVNHTEKQVLLTGTLLGGVASDIFYLLARLDPKRLQKESIGYNDVSEFIRRYGVYEHNYTLAGNDSRKKKGQKEKAGVSPQVFARFLISNCAFLELADLGYALPSYKEEPIFVEMTDLQKQKYNELEIQIGNRMRENAFKGGMKHVSTYVNRLYQYADMPFRQAPITYFDENNAEQLLAAPYNFDIDEFTPPKYHALLQKLDEEIEERNRKVLIYCRFTGANAVDTYLYDKLKEDGYNVGILRSSGSYDGLKMPKQEDREAWLRKQMEKHDWDVLVTNARLVSVGLDLLQFPTIIYYQMDYSTYNYMQSSRRSWRIKQTEPVEVYTMVYRDTIQADVLEHIAKKIDAALALQGKFSEEGLRAMADSGDGINALAKKLMNEGRLDNIHSIEDRWKRINASYEQMQNSKYEGYDEYEMNPLGIDEVRRIAAGMITKLKDDVKSGKITNAELESYLTHLEEMFVQVEDAMEYNKGLKKKDKVEEGQFTLSLF